MPSCSTVITSCSQAKGASPADPRSVCLITGDPGDDRPLDWALKDFLSCNMFRACGLGFRVYPGLRLGAESLAPKLDTPELRPPKSSTSSSTPKP